MLDWSFWVDFTNDRYKRVFIYSSVYDQTEGPAASNSWIKDLTCQVGRTGNDIWTQARKTYYVPDDQGGLKVGGYYRNDPIRSFTYFTAT